MVTLNVSCSLSSLSSPTYWRSRNNQTNGWWSNLWSCPILTLQPWTGWNSRIGATEPLSVKATASLLYLSRTKKGWWTKTKEILKNVQEINSTEIALLYIKSGMFSKQSVFQNMKFLRSMLFCDVLYCWVTGTASYCFYTRQLLWPQDCTLNLFHSDTVHYIQDLNRLCGQPRSSVRSSLYTHKHALTCNFM